MDLLRINDPDWLRLQYEINELSTTAIAVLAGCSQVTVWARLERFDIPRRKSGRRPWRIDTFGRECSYDGEGNCGHAYQLWSAFGVAKTSQPGGRKSLCKACWSVSRAGQRNGEYRAWALKRMGITPEEYAWLLELQAGVCAIHGGPETRKGAIWFCVDHDHMCCPPKKSGQTHCCKNCIRGLLCHDCNVMIGLAEKTGQAWRFSDYLGRRPFLGKGVMSMQHSEPLGANRAV